MAVTDNMGADLHFDSEQIFIIDVSAQRLWLKDPKTEHSICLWMHMLMSSSSIKFALFTKKKVCEVNKHR